MILRINRYAAITGVLLAASLPATALAATSLEKEVTIPVERAAALRSASLKLTASGRSWTIDSKTLARFYNMHSLSDSSYALSLRPGAIYDYLNVYISPKVNKVGANSRFEYVGPNLRLIEGGQKGTIVDGMKTSLAIRDALAKGKPNVAIAMKEYRPTIFSADDFKKLRFPTKLAEGTSNFAGSPANRVHNIQVGTGKMNGVVIMPGEEFSFNRYLGPVDEANGYLPELVIKENVTTPEFGGGICQVSTTAFRAAMQAGFTITYRRNHSYPVKYYGTPGYDATVYQPAPDFRFINDTAAPALLKTSIVGSKVVFDVWGTSDGRQVTINGPFVTEKKPDGSLTAAVAQIVKKNGKTIRETNFVSKYQSPDKFPKVLKANGEKP
jgi:vancomycin resistance protein YoaR